MEVELFGLSLLTSTKPLYSNIIFTHDGWMLSVRPAPSRDEWVITFRKDRGHGDEAKGKLVCVLNREDCHVDYKEFELRETLPHDVTVRLTIDNTTLCIELKEATSILGGRDIEQIIEYNSLVGALLEVEMHLEKLLMYREF